MWPLTSEQGLNPSQHFLAYYAHDHFYGSVFFPFWCTSVTGHCSSAAPWSQSSCYMLYVTRLQGLMQPHVVCRVCASWDTNVPASLIPNLLPLHFPIIIHCKSYITHTTWRNPSLGLSDINQERMLPLDMMEAQIIRQCDVLWWCDGVLMDSGLWLVRRSLMNSKKYDAAFWFRYKS